MSHHNLTLTFFEEVCVGEKNICQSHPLHLEVTNINEAYPYLKHASLDTKLTFSIISLSFVLTGVILKTLIFGFLCSPSETSTLINTLISFQQFCRLCGVAYYLWFALANLVPFSLEDAFGINFCSWFSVFSSFSLFGDIYWSCMLASTRLFYIKYQAWFK